MKVISLNEATQSRDNADNSFVAESGESIASESHREENINMIGNERLASQCRELLCHLTDLTYLCCEAPALSNFLDEVKALDTKFSNALPSANGITLARPQSASSCARRSKLPKRQKRSRNRRKLHRCGQIPGDETNVNTASDVIVACGETNNVIVRGNKSTKRPRKRGSSKSAATISPSNNDVGLFLMNEEIDEAGAN